MRVRSAAEGLRLRWISYWVGPGPSLRLGIFRVLLACVALATVMRFAPSVLQAAESAQSSGVARHWDPVLLLEVLRFPRPSPDLAQAMLLMTLASLGLTFVGLFTFWSSLTAAVTTTLWIASAYSMGKPHHDCIALVFALACLPLSPAGRALSIDALLARRHPIPRASHLPRGHLPLRFTQLTIVIGYMAAGWSKLLLGGTDWLNGYSLQNHVLAHNGPWRELLLRPEAAQLASCVLVLTQATFGLVFVPRLRALYLTLGVTFHLLAWKTMETGNYASLWALYIAFLPLERLVPGRSRALVAPNNSPP